MRDRRDAIAIAVVLATMIALALVLRTRERDASSGDPRASTFLTTPQGARALFLVAGELGMKTRRRLAPFTSAPEADVGALVVLAPVGQFTPREVARLLDWVRDGGTLLYALGSSSRLADSLGLRRIRASTEPALMGRGRGDVARTTDAPLVRAIGILDTVRFVFSETSRPVRGRTAVVLAEARRGPAVIAFPFGAGWVTAVSDVAPLTNAALRDGGAALLFARIVAVPAGDGRLIEFDEYHQGYRAGGGPWAALRSFASTRAGFVAVQLALASLLVLLLAARRFGAPYLPPPARRRSPIEHVEALATAYQRAGARRTARRLLLDGLYRRLGLRPRPRGAGDTGPPPGLERSAVGERFIAEWQRGDAAQLVALSRAMDDVVAEVRRW